MRLIARSSGGELSFTRDLMDEDGIPPYAILSHTWQPGQEVLFDDFLKDTQRSKTSYDKIHFCAQQTHRDDLDHFWIDTCCINKQDHIELQDAINSMFRWYQRAVHCYVYLSDVSTSSGLSETNWETAFRNSRWFTRGWTLQELLAPRSVKFFSKEGTQIGDMRTLERQVHEVTGIATAALQGTPLQTFSFETRLSWMSKRTTTRKEDKVYSLLGIFGVFLPPNYGEGEEYAFKRLRREIDASEEQSWPHLHLTPDGVGDATAKSQYPWLVPFPRPKAFAGREKQLAQLRKHLSVGGGKRLAIHGLGGCGKSALATEFAYRSKQHQPDLAVYWVPAINRENFEKACRDIAELLNIPGHDDPQANVKRLVMSKLSDESSGPWLIIIDNADDADVLFGNSQHGSHRDPLINFVPQSRNGSVIFTTRTRGVALKIAELSLISLGGLERVDAIGLLEERLLPEHRHQLTNTATVNTFLEILSFHALAVVQAIAFMSSNHVTLSEYVAIYKNNESDAVDLLSEQFEDDTRYRETNNAVATTWYISLEQIQQQDPNAAEYLFFMACVGSNDISTLMLPLACKKTEFIKALGTLQAYAFITERQRDTQDLQKASKAFDVHPLVHIVIRNWLKAKDQWIPRVAAALKRMVKITPYGDLCTRDIWTKYLHHAVYVTNIPEVLEMEERAMLLERIGACERELGRYSAAERTYREAFKQRSRTLGENHPDSLRARGNIGLALGFQGKWTEAEKMHREVTTMMTEMLGENHPDTITSREYIALALLGRGKHTEAAELYREQLPSTIEMMGAKHHDTLSVMYNYGVTLRKMGQDAEASRMLQEALELCTEVLGEEDVLTLSCLSSWGTLLHQQGKFADAERVHREALRKRKNSLGSEHPDIVRSMVQLAMALEAQDEYTEAEQLLRDAYEAGKTIFGPKSPAVTFAINALALMLRGQGNYDEAEHLVREVLAIREESLGVDHAETAMSMVSLAKLVSVRLEYKVALPLYKRAYDTFMATFGPDHPTTKDCLENVEDVEYYLTGIRKTKESSNSGPAESSLPAQSDGANTTEVALRPRKKWRVRLQAMVKKS